MQWTLQLCKMNVPFHFISYDFIVSLQTHMPLGPRREPGQRRGGLSRGSWRSYVHQKEVRDAQPQQEGEFGFTEYCDFFQDKEEIGIFRLKAIATNSVF